MELDAIRTLFEERNAFAAHAGVEILDLAEGRATCTMTIGDLHRNPFGTVNAGAIYTLAQTAFAVASNSQGDMTLTTTLAIAYIKPATAGTLTARATERSASGRLGVFTIEVTDDSNELIAEVQATGYRTKRSLEEF